MRTRPARLVPVLAAVLLAPGVSAAADPVCALIDLDRSPRTALLEAKLLAEPGTRWVERTAVAKALEEQKLQALFGPQAGPQRVALGRVLKADVLVMVRPTATDKGPERAPKSDGPAVELVVSETAGGLRLLSRPVPVGDDAGTDAAALLDLVRAGLRKHRDEVREVVAVPPFLSKDLSFQFEHLTGAYARLAEQAAVARPGVVAVELAEAEAIARELRLADPGAVIRRPLPLYLLGEFRHDGQGAARKVTLKLRADRGGKTVGEPLDVTLTPEEAPAAVRRWAAGRFGNGGAAANPADPTAEARQLAELARAHRRTGDWAGAAALIEASLLLDPKQPELNADMLDVLPLRVAALVGRTTTDPDVILRAARIRRRTLDHLEALVTSGAKLARYAKPDRLRMPYAVPGQELPPPSDADRETLKELAEDGRKVYERLIPVVAEQGNPHEVRFYATAACASPSSAERFARLERILLKLRDVRGGTGAAHQLLWDAFPWPVAGKMDPEYPRLLDRLDGVEDREIKSAVAVMRRRVAELTKSSKTNAQQQAEITRKELEHARKAKADPTVIRHPSPGNPDQLEARLKDTPFRWVRLTTDGSPGGPPHRLRGILPAGPGADLLWDTSAVYVMKEKGKLRPLYRVNGSELSVSLTFDGRYAWVATEKRTWEPGGWARTPVLLVLDLTAEKAYEVTAEDGLPIPPEAVGRKEPFENLPLAVTELGPGRACVVGSFGRAWVAVAAFDPARGKATVKVIHEARDAQDQGDPDQWKKTTVAFQPARLHTLRGDPGPDGKAPVRVLIGRGWPSQKYGTANEAVRDHPLLIDPDGPAADVVRQPIRTFDYLTSAGTGRSVYVCPAVPGPSPARRLYRIDYPGTVRDLGPGPAADLRSPMHFDGRQLHVAHVNHSRRATEPEWPASLADGRPLPNDWWTAGPDGTDLRKLRLPNVPLDFLHFRVQAVGTSSHYGLVALLDLGADVILCRVELPDPDAK